MNKKSASAAASLPFPLSNLFFAQTVGFSRKHLSGAVHATRQTFSQRCFQAMFFLGVWFRFLRKVEAECDFFCNLCTSGVLQAGLWSARSTGLLLWEHPFSRQTVQQFLDAAHFAHKGTSIILVLTIEIRLKGKALF